MNSSLDGEALRANCCTLPIETIASDRHKTDDVCCLITEKTTAPDREKCPVSNTSSRKVQHRTVEHLVTLERRTLIADVQYYFCAEPTCEVIYFSTQNNTTFTTADILVKVFSKDSGEDVNVCYCFDWTRGRIKEQINKTGNSTASVEIAKEVKAGRCLCDVKNPKGECCLGDVNRVVKEVLSPGKRF